MSGFLTLEIGWKASSTSKRIQHKQRVTDTQIRPVARRLDHFADFLFQVSYQKFGRLQDSPCQPSTGLLHEVQTGHMRCKSRILAPWS